MDSGLPSALCHPVSPGPLLQNQGSEQVPWDPVLMPVILQARHLTQLRTLSDPPGGVSQGQDPSSRGRGRNHDHEETDDELGTNIVSLSSRCPFT